MNRVARHTWLLTGCMLVLLAFDVWVHRPAVDEQRQLPQIHAFALADVTQLELTRGDEQVTFALQDGTWHMTAPQQFVADQSAVIGLLNSVRRGVSMDARVDRKSDDRYGLEGGKGILVEMSGPTGVVNAFYLGANTPGGTTFVRFPGSEDVYRARIGGRSRFDATAGDWRDRTVLQFDDSKLDRLALQWPDGTTRTFVASPYEAGRNWLLEENPAFRVDRAEVMGLLEELAHLRAGELLPPDHPVEGDFRGTVTVTAAGTTHTLRIWDADQDQFYVKVPDRPAVFRVGGSAVSRLLRPLDDWADKQLLDLDAALITGLVLVEPSLTSELRRTGSDWTLVRPKNVEVEPRQALVASRAVARLRAFDFPEVTPAAAGFPSRERIEITLEDDRRIVLEIGGIDPSSSERFEQRYVRVAEQPERIGLVPGRSLARIKQAWGR